MGREKALEDIRYKTEEQQEVYEHAAIKEILKLGGMSPKDSEKFIISNEITKEEGPLLLFDLIHSWPKIAVASSRFDHDWSSFFEDRKSHPSFSVYSKFKERLLNEYNCYCAMLLVFRWDPIKFMAMYDASMGEAYSFPIDVDGIHIGDYRILPLKDLINKYMLHYPGSLS